MLVMLSSLSRPSDAQRFADAGFSAFLSSPAPQHMLLEILTILCSTSNSRIKPPFLTAAALSASISEFEQSPPFANYRLLVADDNIVNQRVAAHMLKRLGCTVDFAASGHAVIAMHAEKCYDLIFMDCQMPGLDGYDTTALIRLTEAHEEHVPIIALTANAIQGEREKCLAAGMDDYLSKPIRMQMLREVLAKWLPSKKIYSDSSSILEFEFAATEDLEAVRQFFGAGFTELAQLFKTDSAKRIASLRAAGGDMQQIALTAHVLSGSCASIGARTLSELCQSLEAEERTGTPQEKIEARITEIVREYEKVEFMLQTMLLESGMSKLKKRDEQTDA
jgi:CheY-like chemotaxis protein/HPt (histidine-containing phosphotransfer) domain-containing protein